MRFLFIGMNQIIIRLIIDFPQFQPNNSDFAIFIQQFPSPPLILTEYSEMQKRQ